MGEHILWWCLLASLVVWTVKRLPTMWETSFRSLCPEGPLEKEMATHSSIHAWKIPWTEEPSGLQSMGSQSRTRLSDFSSSSTLSHPVWYQTALESALLNHLAASAGDWREGR